MKLRSSGIIFQCDTPIATARAKTLMTKEPGTIKWLDELTPDDVLYDVGANVGCYTLYAAQRGVKVIAFEPHFATVALLEHNVHLNNYEDRVTIVAAPLDWHSGMVYFEASSQEPGSSGHSVNTQRKGRQIFALSVDDCVAMGLPRATALKLDVDGNELRILHGALETLAGIRSAQVEMPTLSADEIRRVMSARGFETSCDHFTAMGQKQLDSGVPKEQIVYNTIFDRRRDGSSG